MKSHFLLSVLIGFVCSSSAPACEFLAPLAGYEISKGESLHQFSNGTLSIPIQKATSGERTFLYSNENELFYWNTVSEKKTYNKNQWGIFVHLRTCLCMKSLVANNPRSEFLRDQKGKVCSELDCLSTSRVDSAVSKGTRKKCLFLDINGHFLEFEKLKAEMHVNVEDGEMN